MRLNNILLGLFLAVSLVHSILILRSFNIKAIVSRGWPILVFFLLAVMATWHDWDASSFKFLEKYWSFLLVPMAILSDHKEFHSRGTYIFYALVLGCTATLLICYGNLSYELITQNQALDEFFSWQHVGHQFTAIADTHPTYLGLFIVTSILFLIQEERMNRLLKFGLFLFMLMGLFQLANRMVILLFAIFFLFLITTRITEYRQQLIGLVLSVLICAALFVTIGREYMEDRIFSKETVTDTRRIERWQISYEIFKEHPLTGAGFREVRELRREKYRENNYPLSAESDYNAHNQMLEYLSTNGAIGGFVYVFSLTFLFLMSIVRREGLYTFIFLIFILANFTESTMVRIKGIEFFALFTSLFMCGQFLAPRKRPYLTRV